MNDRQDCGFRSASVCSFDPNEYYRKPRRRCVKKQASAEKKLEKPAFSRVVQLCAVRDRSALELSERLSKDGYPADEAKAAIMRACECNLVNDERFADSFIRCKVAAGKGAQWIQTELAKHGIDASQLSDWPCGYGLEDDSQLERAIQFLETHPPRSKDQYSGAYRKLVQRGYPGAIANRATCAWLGR